MTIVNTLWPVAAGVAIGVPGLWYSRRNTLFALWWYGTWTVICTVLSAINAAQGDWGWAAVMAACAVVNGISWWQHWKRRKRDRAAALAGAKSRARIAALVAKAREHARPRPVLRPAPGRQP